MSSPTRRASLVSTVLGSLIVAECAFAASTDPVASKRADVAEPSAAQPASSNAPATAGASSPDASSSSSLVPWATVEPQPAIATWLVEEPEQKKSDRIDDEGYYRSIYQKFSLSLGAAAFRKFNTSLQVSGDAGAGANLDMEDLLGLEESSTVARLDGRYGFNRRHWLEFSYYDIQRDGNRSVAEDIDFGDVTIPAGDVDSKFDTQIFKLAYRYNFVTDPRTVIGASFGVHLMRIDTALKSEDFDVSESFKVNAPLPLIGLHGAYALSEKWSLNASAEFLQFDLGAYRGLITDTRLTLNHDTFEHFGWGIGFNGFQVDANVDGNNDLSAELDYGYQGVMLYLRLLF